MRSILLSDAAAQFLAFAAETVSPITYALYERYVNRLVDAFPGRRLETLTPAEVRAWGKTYHVVQAVQRLCSWAAKEARLVAVNPLEGMRKTPRGRRLRVLSPLEVVRMLRFAKDSFRHLLLALRESYARPGELRRARLEDVRVAGLQPASDEDLCGGRAFVYLDDFKARDRFADRHAVRVIPVSARLGRLIARLRRRSKSGQGPIFTNSRGEAWTVNAVICRLRRMRAAGAASADHRGENVVAYSMRHTSATAWIVAGGDVATLSAVLGHTDIRMTTRYMHLAPVHLADAVKDIERRKKGFAGESDRLGRR